MIDLGPLVLYEDNHLLIVNKPSGMLVQGDSTGDQPLSELSKLYIKRKYGKPGDVFLGVVHRIDRPVSGIVVMARTSKALERMNEIFRTRKVLKTYWAITTTQPPATHGQLVHWLKKNPSNNKTTAFTSEAPDALRSELAYRILGERKGNFLVEVLPVTGRSHQIRAQLAASGFPVRSDLKYGDRHDSVHGRIHLHARALKFPHPVTKVDIAVTAALPADEIWELFGSFEQ